MTKQGMIGWAAGFFEGEGSVCFSLHKDQRLIHMAINQVDKEPLDQFCRIVGQGKVNGPNGPYAGVSRQPIFTWRVSSLDKVCTVANLLWPYLSTRRQNQILDAVGRYEAVIKVTTAAKNLAKTHCPKNHPYSKRNTYIDKTGARECRTCKREKARIARASKK